MKRILQGLLAFTLIAVYPAAAQPDYVDTLGPAQGITLATGTDVVSAGVGLRETGSGMITLEVPAGATVEQVLLYWAGRAQPTGNPDRDADLLVDGNLVVGRHIGDAGLSVPTPAFAYRADITGLGLIGPGTNEVDIDGFDDPDSGGNFWPDGASIVAIISEGSASPIEFIARDGADFAWRDAPAGADPEVRVTVEQIYTFDPEPEARTAKLVLLVGDTQTDRPGRLLIKVDGNVFLDEYDYFQQNSGAQWSNREEPIALPANATSVSVQLFSESPLGPTAEFPESLTWVFAGLAVPPVEDQDPGCTLTQGYWKTHSEYGPAPYDATWALLPDGADTEFFETGESWYTVFHTPPRGGNAYIQLAHQWMAAYLNVLAGAEDSAVASEIAEGADLLDEFDGLWDNPRALKRNHRSDFDRMGDLASTLDDYNNGLIGPGHCDDNDGDDAAEGPQYRSSASEAAFGIAAYPNPMRDQATLSITLDEQTPIRAAVYDVMGRRVALLADETLAPGTHQLPFDASELANGVYVYRVEMPNRVETGRISVVR